MLSGFELYPRWVPLEHFYAELYNKKGEDHGPESLKVMMESLDRYLKNKGCTLSILRDREFSSSK